MVEDKDEILNKSDKGRFIEEGRDSTFFGKVKNYIEEKYKGESNVFGYLKIFKMIF